MADLHIDKELAELLPPLTTEERLKLEDSLKLYGCKDSIVIWKEQNTVVDGHNRFQICQRLQIPFSEKQLSFASKDAVKLWMLKNQLSRRNLNAFHRTRAQLLIANLEKSVLPEDSKELDMLPDGQASFDEPKSKTLEKVAKQAGVSPDTVRKVSYLEDNIDDSTREKLMKGETSISREYQSLKTKEKKDSPPIEEKFAPEISKADVATFLKDETSAGNSYDLLLTEPPSYQEFKKNGSVSDYLQFYKTWLELAIPLLNPEARMFIFADTDIYILNQLMSLSIEVSNEKIQFKDLLIWTFKPSQKDEVMHDFRKNWQGILYFKGQAAETEEKFKDLNTVLHFIKDLNNDFKFKNWRKPVHLLRKLIQLSVRPGQYMLDPFAGSAHFLVTAARAHSLGRGCDINAEMIQLAIENGCLGKQNT